jgi:phosphatidylserine/phosphatidylglycerophosphate/cardiolipin synthase-like enzyme
VIEVRTLTDGGQTAESVAAMIADFVSEARATLDLALYDLALGAATRSIVSDALTAASRRGVRIRLAYNRDRRVPIPVPPPSAPDVDWLAPSLAESRPIAGIPSLMHQKYVIRDGADVWTGSTNWRDDAWTREENVIAIVAAPAIAALYARDFEQLWARGVGPSGDVDVEPISLATATVRVWFCPGRARSLVHRIARAVGRAQTRVRIASPIVTAAPILATLVETAADRRLDLAGVLDATQMREVATQWETQHRRWKRHLMTALLETAPFSGKASTPWSPSSVHDFMHAKVTVADGRTFIGSYNLSHAGEDNAENVLEIEDAALAERMAKFVDELRSRYPRLVL